MPLVSAKCTNCGANLEVDNTKDAAICPYCGTPYIVEKAINSYNISTSYVVVNNATIINDEEVADTIYNRVEIFIKLGEWNKASLAVDELIAKYPMDYRGWLGKNILVTNNFTNISNRSHDWIIENFEKANAVASVEEKKVIAAQKQIYDEIYKKGICNAEICNRYSREDIERALGCNLIEKSYDNYYEVMYYFYKIIYVYGHKIEYSLCHGTDFEYKETTCKENVDNVISLFDSYRIKSEQQGCYIATCVYGSYDCPEVWTLRRFRDYTLDETWYGRLFIKCYYAISPTLVKRFGNQKWFRKFWKSRLDAMVEKLNREGIEDSQYSDKY